MRTVRPKGPHNEREQQSDEQLSTKQTAALKEEIEHLLTESDQRRS